MENEKDQEQFKERRLELASKLMKMGRSLVEEDNETGFENATHAGSTLILLSGLILNDDDMLLFQHTCSMFTSKQILDQMMSSPFGGMGLPMMGSMGQGDRLDFLEKIMNKMKDKEEDGDSKEE